jgi:putative ABC transport system permease protein
VRLAAPHPVDTLQAALVGVPGVRHAEFWPGASPYLIGASGVAGSPVALLGLDPESRLLDLEVISGRWLDRSTPTGAVINNAVLALNPALRVGGAVGLRLDARTLEFPIVGVVKELTPQPVVYAPAPAMLAATGQSGAMARTIRIVTEQHTDAAQLAAARAVEGRFQDRGIEVAGLHRMGDMKKSVLDHLVIIMVILTLAASIVVLVGTIGLTSTLTINVLQRTREIGVMSAVGATPRMIAAQVWCEGIWISVLSWIAATLLAAPVSYVLETVTGRMFFRVPLDFTVSAGAAALWLGLVVVLASASSLYPAWRAARLTVREAIAHV